MLPFSVTPKVFFYLSTTYIGRYTKTAFVDTDVGRMIVHGETSLCRSISADSDQSLAGMRAGRPARFRIWGGLQLGRREKSGNTVSRRCLGGKMEGICGTGRPDQVHNSLKTKMLSHFFPFGPLTGPKESFRFMAFSFSPLLHSPANERESKAKVICK